MIADPPAVPLPARSSAAKERIIDAAYALFSRHGTRPVGIDAIIERSGVAKMTLYRHYRSKQDLVLAFLQRREQLWLNGWLAKETRKRGEDPKARLLAVFDIFHEWFATEEFEGCSFIVVLMEYDHDSTIHRAASGHLARVRAFLKDLATEAGIADPGGFAGVWQMLMNGSVVACCAGDRAAAAEARRGAELLLRNWPVSRSGSG